jgi:hypothetical protein
MVLIKSKLLRIPLTPLLRYSLDRSGYSLSHYLRFRFKQKGSNTKREKLNTKPLLSSTLRVLHPASNARVGNSKFGCTKILKIQRVFAGFLRV